MSGEHKKRQKKHLLHLPFKEREYFTENLALLLKAAVPIGEALESLSASVKSKAFKKAIAGLQADIEAGYNLTGALEYSGIVGSQTIALVRMGEASGNLVENLKIAADQEQKRHIFVSKVRSCFCNCSDDCCRTRRCLVLAPTTCRYFCAASCESSTNFTSSD
jgi:type II secretory pathway component PulF